MKWHKFVPITAMNAENRKMCKEKDLLFSDQAFGEDALEKKWWWWKLFF